MRILFILIFIITSYFSVFSQDFIKKNNGDTIWCKISEINLYYLKFKTDSTTRFLSIDSIFGYKLEVLDFVEIDKEIKIKNQIVYPQSKKSYLFAVIPGIGENHGIGGVKVLIGNGTSGFFGCVGYGIMTTFWKIGLQVNANWFYFAISTGTMRFTQSSGSFDTKIKTAIGMTLEVGGLINLTKDKRFFVQLGLGYNVTGETINPYSYYYGAYIVDFSGLRPDIGIGVKF